jgi:hypothetical protein
MRVSKFIKPHKDILIEYIYDDGNNISETYKILQNIRDNTLSYIAGDGSSTANIQTNQLFVLDSVTNNYGKVNTDAYSFLQVRDYASGFPIRHDIIKVHIPINYTFGEYLGFYLKVYAYNYTNEEKYTLSNFYFDITDVDQSQFLDYNSPPLYFQEKLWGKNITINIPSVYAVARQRVNNSVKANTINANLTNNTGFSLTTPIFMEFQFVAGKRTVNRVTTYTLASKIPMSLPQAPDFENIGVQIVHSTAGDFFEIYGTFNGDINQFDNFINGSVQLGNRYYVTYTITLFEQNIRGKTFTITITDNFNEKVEYRPIIKYSTTTAIIDVEMNIIDAVDNSTIYRKASYGMLQDEVAKYSLRLMKINLDNAAKPKIYNIKSPEGAGIFGSKTNGKLEDTKSNVVLEPIKINYAVLADRFNVVAKSDNVIVGQQNFYGLGKLEILLQPFDNILQLKIARDITTTSSSGTNVKSPEYMDMTNMGEIKFIIKDDKVSFETGLYFGSNEVDLSKGFVVFRIPSGRMNDIKKISDGGMNLFYVVARTDTGTTVVYSGLFKIYDSAQNIESLRNLANQTTQESLAILDETRTSGIADVTRRSVTQTIPTNAVKLADLANRNRATVQANNNTSESTTTTDTSSKSTYIESKTIYLINTDSSLSVNNYPFTAQNLKSVLNLPIIPTELTFKGDSIYSKGGLLDKTSALYKKLVAKYITPNPDLKSVFEQVQKDFLEREYGETIQTPFDQEAKELADKEKKMGKIGSNTTTDKKKGKLGK